MTKVTKFSKYQEIKALSEKQKQLDTDESDFLDDISRDDNDRDSDYIPETPQNNTGKSIKQRKTHLKSHHLKRHHLKRHNLKLDHFLFQKPKATSLLKRKIKNKKKKKNVDLDTENLVTTSKDREKSCSENETTTILKFTVKKDWHGTENHYVPEIFDDFKKEIWHNLITKGKEEIEKELDKISGNSKSIEKVHYSGRLRLKFPCSVKNCEFKRQWTWQNT